MKQVQDAYIVAATRTPIGRSGRGYFRNTRPDELLVAALRSAMLQVPTLDPKAIEDAIIGCSFPEGEQGMNMARVAVGLAFDHPVGGITVNRFCASGISAIQMAADRIRVGEADVLIAGGAESMSMVPMGGGKPSFNPEVFARDENVGIAYGMGLTAEKVAQQWKVTREMQDAFALESHLRAIKAQQAGEFTNEITPIDVIERTPNLATGEVTTKTRTVSLDEGPRPDTSHRGPGQTEARVRRPWQRHCRQQLADQRWRRRADSGQRKGGQAIWPDTVGPFCVLCCTRRATGNHGHWPYRSHSCGLALRRSATQRYRLV